MGVREQINIIQETTSGILVLIKYQDVFKYLHLEYLFIYRYFTLIIIGVIRYVELKK